VEVHTKRWKTATTCQPRKRIVVEKSFSTRFFLARNYILNYPTAPKPGKQYAEDLQKKAPLE